MRAVWITALSWLTMLPLAGWTAELRRQAPEQRALAYLAREVPRWSAANHCFSCHNNGDGARALYTAARLGWRIPRRALADTTRWLTRPDRWDHNGGDQEFSDQKLARLQFAAALTAASAAGQVKDRKFLNRAARLVAEHQQPDGSWPIGGDSLGSPATYGVPLATYLAQRTLQKANARQYRPALTRSGRWFRQAPVRNVLDTAAILLGLGKDRHAAALAQRRRCLALLRKGQSRDGGWGPYVNSPSEPFDTAVVLLALCRHTDKAGVRLMLRRGRGYLVAVQEADGSWPETTRPAGSISYAQHISTTAWATLALLALRSTPARPAAPARTSDWPR